MADNTNQIIFPAEFGTLRGRIAPIVQDSPSTYTIYARRKNGDYVDITGATITARFTSTTAGGDVYASTGTFTVVDGENGKFTWLPSEADLGLDGSYYLQFTVDGERSEDSLRWTIQARLDSSGSVTPTALAELTAEEMALITALRNALPAAEGDIFKYTGGAWTTTAESGGGASDVLDLTTTTGTPAQRLRVAGAGGLEYRTTEQDLADLRDAGALATPDIGVTVQGYDADLAAIAALSPSNDDVVQRKAGAWTNRTIEQVRTDLAVLPEDAAIVAVSSGRDLATTDRGKILECNGTFTLTCPDSISGNLQCAIVNVGTGVITLAATTTLTTKGGAVTLAEQYAGATVYYAGSGVWRAIGDLT